MKLDRIVADLGVSLREGPVPCGWWGAYDHRIHTITLLPNLGPTQYRSTLAHELGHAYHRHQGTTTHTEWQASVWAARQLINLEEFHTAVLAADTVLGVAAILEVMPRDVETYFHAMKGRERRQIQRALAAAKST